MSFFQKKRPLLQSNAASVQMTEAEAALAQSDFNIEKITEIQNKFTGGAALLVPGRIFIREGLLLKVCRKGPKKRQFFLFNDILVYGSVVAGRYSNQHILPLSQMVVSGECHYQPSVQATFTVESDQLDQQLDVDSAFQISHADKSFHVFALSVADRSNWLANLQKHITRVMQLAGGSEQTVQRAVWVPDSVSKECMICRQRFTAFVRKHHCRRCGRLVCSSCSPHRMNLNRKEGSSESQLERACKQCFQQISSAQTQRERKDNTAGTSQPDPPPPAAVAAQVVSNVLRSRSGKAGVALPSEDSSTDTEDSDDSGNEGGEEKDASSHAKLQPHIKSHPPNKPHPPSNSQPPSRPSPPSKPQPPSQTHPPQPPSQTHPPSNPQPPSQTHPASKPTPKPRAPSKDELPTPKPRPPSKGAPTQQGQQPHAPSGSSLETPASPEPHPTPPPRKKKQQRLKQAQQLASVQDNQGMTVKLDDLQLMLEQVDEQVAVDQDDEEIVERDSQQTVIGGDKSAVQTDGSQELEPSADKIKASTQSEVTQDQSGEQKDESELSLMLEGKKRHDSTPKRARRKKYFRPEELQDESGGGGGGEGGGSGDDESGGGGGGGGEGGDESGSSGGGEGGDESGGGGGGEGCGSGDDESGGGGGGGGEGESSKGGDSREYGSGEGIFNEGDSGDGEGSKVHDTVPFMAVSVEQTDSSMDSGHRRARGRRPKFKAPEDTTD